MIHESLSIGPSYVLFVLVFVSYLILPGALAGNLLFGRRAHDPFMTLPLSLSLGLAHSSFWCVVAYFAGSGVRTTMILSFASTLVLVGLNVFAWIKRRARPNHRRTTAPPAVAESYSKLVRLVIWGLIGACFLLVFFRGAVFSWSVDALDHVGTIREIVESDKIFPVNSFYAGEEGLGADPRKGLYHTALAAVSSLTGIEPNRIWVWLPSVLLPLLLLACFSFTRELFRDEKIAAVATILFVLTAEGGSRDFLRSAGIPAQVAYQTYLIALTLVFRYIRAKQLVYLAASAIVGSTIGTVHIYFFFQLGLALTAFLLFVLLIKQFKRALVISIIKVGFAVVVLSIPFLAVKYTSSYSVQNPFDEQLRHVLFFSDKLYVVNPAEPWNLVGPLAIFAFVMSLFLYRRARTNDGVLFVFAATVVTPLIIYNPLVVPVLGKLITTGLVRRIALLTPFVAVLGLFTTEMLGRLLSAPEARKKIKPAVFLGVMVVLLVPSVGDLIYKFGAQEREKERRTSPFAWYGALEFLKNEVRTPSVIMSDPWTSFSVPAFTQHYIVAVPIGHSSPKDAQNVQKVGDAKDALNPYVDLAATRSILDKYRVDFVILNETFTGPIVDHNWSLHPGMYSDARAKFDEQPGLFDLVYNTGKVRIYRYKRSGEALAVHPPVPPFVFESAPEMDAPVNARFEEQFVLLGVARGKESAHRGEVVRFKCYWQKTGKETLPKHYRVFVRFDTEYDKDWLYDAAWSKLYRYGLQKIRGERYRFRSDHNPVNGVYPPHRWQPGEVIEDAFSVRIPHDVAPGFYDIKIKLYAMPFSPNYYIADFLRDNDVYSGVTAGSMEITR